MAMSGDNSRGTGAGAPVPLRQGDVVAGPEEVNLPQTAGNGKGKKNKAQKNKVRKKKAKARKQALRQAARAQHGPQAKQVGGRGQGALADIPDVVQVQPIARPARLKTRHWGLIFSFFLLVLAPLCGVVFYLTTYANDQYLSTTGFTVRSQDTGGSNELLGGLAQFAGGTTASDSDMFPSTKYPSETPSRVSMRIESGGRNSYAPLSTPAPTTRASPRWSLEIGRIPLGDERK